MTLLHVLHMLSPLVIYFSDCFCFALRGTKIIMKKIDVLVPFGL